VTVVELMSSIESAPAVKERNFFFIGGKGMKKIGSNPQSACAAGLFRFVVIIP
jgi:hypothetical protein